MFRRRFSPGPWAVTAAFVILSALTLAGCLGPSLADDQGSGSSSARVHQAEPGTSDAGTGARDTVYVNIRNFRFHPGDLRISTGTRVVFVNEDDVAHNIVQTSSHRVGTEPGIFESPVLEAGQQWAFVFEQAGEYPIICTVGGHQLMGMQGRIVVSDD